jgi:EmrB/QacA subfamily drug resistance transporter
MSAAIYPVCDRALATAAVSAPCSAPRTLVLITTTLASGLAFVDGSVINVALPAIAQGLDADAAGLQWVVNAYLLPLSALLLFGGAAGDFFGPRRILMAGIALFSLASIGCALAPDLRTLLASRLLQGIGAAMLTPNSLAILGQTFSGEAKGRAIGIWAATGAALGAVGPVIGGALIDLGSWRAIFLLNVPIAIAALVLGRRSIARDQEMRHHPLDIPGGALVTAGLAALTWALTVGAGTGGWTRAAVSGVILSVGLLLVFLRIESRRGVHAIMPLELFASKTLVGLTLFTFLLYGAMGAVYVLVPYLLMEAFGYSAAAAGAALLPLPLILAITSPTAGRIAGRIGARPLLVIGTLIVAAGFLLGLRIDVRANYWLQVLPMMLMISLGMSAAVAPLTTAVLTAVDARHVGSASGLNSAVARTGSLIATALLGVVLAAHGQLLVLEFHTAAIAAAATCVAASLSAFTMLQPRPEKRSA